MANRGKVTVVFDVNTVPGELHKLDIKFHPKPKTPAQRRAADKVVDHLKEIFREVAQ